MLTQDMDGLLRGAQFMTEKAGGSDISRSALTARRSGDHWELWGDKWFCSCADSEVVLLLARCEDAPKGNAGLSLFLMPRTLDDGTRNRYRLVRLKDKLGSRSMASGEAIMEGARQATIVENVIKTRLIGTQTRMHDLLVFLSVVGGLFGFGLLGLLYGPIIAILFLTFTELYRRTYRHAVAERFARV